MTHLFILKNQIEGNVAHILGEDFRHVKSVLRMTPGESLTLSDENGVTYHAEISGFTDNAVLARILSSNPGKRELPVKIALFQGFPKGDKTEFILQKATELGVHEIVPVFMARSVVKLDEKKSSAKAMRYESVLKSAAEQSKRDFIPKLHSFLTEKEAVCYAKNFDHIFVAYENAEGMKSTRECFRSVKKGESVAVFVGPEGGFADEEIGELKENGAHILSLGRRILRTETAPIAILSMMNYEWEE